jgi:hypothetical protein
MTRQRASGFQRFLRLLGTIGMALMLVASAGGAYLWVMHGQASIESYQSPMRLQPRSPGQPSAPLVPEVVLVIIDGLRCDAVANMPTLSLLQKQGATARAFVHTPSYSQPTWTTLVTGAWPELNGAALLNAPDDAIRPIAPDHIFAAAKRAGLTTALAGASWWEKMIPQELLDAHFFTGSFKADGDQQSADAGLRFITNFHPNLTLIYFGNVDETAHEAGATSAAYREAALGVDNHLHDIVQSLDLRRSVLIVTADHGHIDRGGHGGGDASVVYTPFVAVGAPVLAGNYGTIDQADIAPTIAAILGAPVPRLSQGVVRFEMLRTDEAKRAQVELDVAQQRREFAALYLASIGRGSLSETAQGDVQVAQSSMEVGNLESAFGLASIAADRIDQEVAQAREQRIQAERRLRLPVAAAAVAVPLLLLLARGGRRGLWLFVAALLTQAAYHLLFLRQGGLYSFSVLSGLNDFIIQTAQRVALASVVGAIIVVWRLIREHEGSVLGVIRASLGYSLLVIYLLGCQAAVAYWLNGFRWTWYVPNMTVAFVQLSALAQVILTAAVGAILPIVLLLAGVVYQAARSARRRLRFGAGS